MLTKNNHTGRLLVLLFFSILMTIGLMIFDDYGISWDEPVQRYNGLLNYNYVVKDDPALLTFFDRDYGPVIEFFLIVIEKMIQPRNLQGVYLIRHFCLFLIFFMGVWFFYKLGQLYFKSYWLPLLGCLFLVISPRIFGHAFFNSKDIPFMTVFIISIYTMIRWLEKQSISRTLFHSFVCAILVDIRIMGMFVFFLSSFFFFWQKWFNSGKPEMTYRLKHWLIYLMLFGVLMMVFWPFLWKDPFGNLLESFINMSQFRWQGTVLYFGRHITATDLPWHYPLVWIFISTPILYLVTACFGFWSFAHKLVKGGLRNIKKNIFSHDMILMDWFLVPLLAVIILNPVLYDGWRHLFFIYPALILMSIRGIQTLWNAILKILPEKKLIWRKPTFFSIITIGIILPAGFMIHFHPFQNVYFNSILRGNLEWTSNQFDMDYWGLSYRKGFEFIVSHDPNDTIPVYVENDTGRMNALMLPLPDRKRLKFVKKPEEAAYYITIFRWQRNALSYQNEIYSVDIDGAKILSVFKLENPLPPESS